MNPLYCSKGHENPAGSHFCLHCGEKLSIPVVQTIQPGQKLGDRYVIVRQLGQGGFGRTYLAEDSNRFNELCVLKEFCPQVQTAYVLQKAEELFEREAGVLYKLQHPQIPKFRELLRLNLAGKAYLFLVQDYVEGQTYRNILTIRRQQGLQLSEAEMRQLMLQILPVLDYIHSQGVIHRDISPDNLILRNSDQQPVLIDFGGVKQIVAQVNQSASTHQPHAPIPSTPATLLGKVGYAPHEQMQQGLVYPHSDLYALAATVLVLLTGKEPLALMDMRTFTWYWRREINLSPSFGAILDRMLSQLPNERYQTAQELLQALTPPPAPTYYPPTPPPIPPQPNTSATVAVSPAAGGEPQGAQTPPPRVPPVAANQSARISPQQGFWGMTPGKIALVALLLTTAGGLGLWGANALLGSRSPGDNTNQVSPPPDTSTNEPDDNRGGNTVEPPPSPQLSPAEQARKQKIRQRRQQLGVDYNYYVDTVNQLFWQKNPSLNGRRLSDRPEDADLRGEWDKVGTALLSKIEEANLSSSARSKLGSYSSADRERWQQTVNKLNLSTRALYDLTDGKYALSFSDYSARKLNLSFEQFLNKPIGQIWYAIADDRVKAIQSGTALERVVFDSGATGKQVSGSLKPGEGKAYIAGLEQGQNMTVNLSGKSGTLLSIYPPSSQLPALLADSTEKSWSGKLESKGFYEFVVVATSEPVDYQLSINAEDLVPQEPTPEPTATEEPSPTPTATPTEVPTPSPTPTPTPTEEVAP